LEDEFLTKDYAKPLEGKMKPKMKRDLRPNSGIHSIHLSPSKNRNRIQIKSRRHSMAGGKKRIKAAKKREIGNKGFRYKL
jgi:hypothetical protein